MKGRAKLLHIKTHSETHSSTFTYVHNLHTHYSIQYIHANVCEKKPHITNVQNL